MANVEDKVHCFQYICMWVSNLSLTELYLSLIYFVNINKNRNYKNFSQPISVGKRTYRSHRLPVPQDYTIIYRSKGKILQVFYVTV